MGQKLHGCKVVMLSQQLKL